MFAAVELLYRNGERIKPQWPPLVGQLMSEHDRGKQRLNLWPVDWLGNVARQHWPDPLAVLWQPSGFGALQEQFIVTGLERVGRRVFAQQWRCLPLTGAEAMTYLRDHDPSRFRFGEIHPAATTYMVWELPEPRSEP